MATLDRDLLEAALIGFEHQKNAIDLKIAQLRAHLGGHVAPALSPSPSTAKEGRRTFSAETRRRMALAQQKRWASKLVAAETAPAVVAAEPVAKKAAKKKRRTLSPEARERIAAAQKKRWAAAKKSGK